MTSRAAVEGERKMTEQETNATGEVVDSNADYIAAINELKQNSVDRSKYEQLRAENKRLLDSIVNGQSAEVATKQAEKPSIEELRERLFKDEPVSNLEYVTNALELRQALIESGEKDPFLPWGNKIIPTTEDIECAERVARVMQECVDYADGDSELFTNELQRRTIDSGMPRRK